MQNRSVTMPPPRLSDFRTVVAVDVVSFGDRSRTDVHRMVIREGLYQVVATAFVSAGIPWDACQVEDRGDGVLVIAPSDVSSESFVAALPDVLIDGLRRHNAAHAEPARIRLRMVVHSGEVRFDAHGVIGMAVVTAFRLLDAADLRQALAESDGLLGMVVSDSFFSEVVRSSPMSRPETYRPVRVAVKEYRAQAWIRLPDSPPPRKSTTSLNAARDVLVGFTAPDRDWADWITWHLRDAGYTVELDPALLRPTENLGERLTDAFNHADRVVLVLSRELQRLAQAMPGARDVLTGTDRRLLAVQVDRLETSLFEAVVDISTDKAEAARHRILAAVESHPATSIAAPRFPGDSASPRPSPADQSPDSPQRERAVIIHAEADRTFAVDLADALVVLEAEDVLSPVELRAVGDLDEETEQHVDEVVRRADVVLLVVSRELFATGYGAGRESRFLVRSHAERRITLLPVVLRPTSWEKSVFGKLVSLPSSGIPVSQWTSRDEAIASIVNGVRLSARGPQPVSATVRPDPGQPVLDLGEVFKQTGVPTLTFVEPEEFFRFRMALRQPGLGIVLEGPSGVGKTTLLRRAVAQDAGRLGDVTIFSARVPADLPKIRNLLGGHTGLVAVDDFQRLPVDLQDRLADYVKTLADDDTSSGKLIVVGIPGTARELIELGYDVATRIKVFRLGRVRESLLLQMVEKGEVALNITFDRRAEIVMAAAGSLLTAQMLCSTLAMMAGIEQTTPDRITVRTDIERARVEVTEELHLKYQRAVSKFVALDGPSEVSCAELLLALSETADGVLPLDQFTRDRPELRSAIGRVFVDGLPTGLTGKHDEIATHLCYDPRGRRLVADDPQFIFYLRQLSRQRLLSIAGKRQPMPRDRIFLCYSRRDIRWKERVEVHLQPLERKGVIDVWSDRRIEFGDVWREEIAAALDRARIAVLLVSADFFASDFINSHELPPLLKAAAEGGCRVIPLLVAPSMFSDVPELACFQALPRGATLSELSTEDGENALVELTRSLSHAFPA